MPEVSENVPPELSPVLAPSDTIIGPPAPPSAALPGSWRPFRTLLPAIITFIISGVVGGGIFLLILTLGGKSPACSELAVFLCVGLGAVITAAVALVVATTIGIVLLRRAHVERAGNVLFMAYVCSFLVTSGLYRLLPALKLSPMALLVTLVLASTAIFVASSIFSDWYVNAIRISGWIKVLLVVLAATAGMAAVRGGGGVASVAMPAQASELRSALAASNVTLLIPPPNSSYPQPYDIAAQDNAAAQPDYRVGAYFGIDTGKQNGTTLYEYKVDEHLDPIAGCANISSMLVSQYDGHTTCQLVTTLPSGTKIYGPAGGNGHQFFIIKHGTAAIYAPPTNMSDQQAYEFLDHLQPLEIDSFITTLHQKNPQQY